MTTTFPASIPIFVPLQRRGQSCRRIVRWQAGGFRLEELKDTLRPVLSTVSGFFEATVGESDVESGALYADPAGPDAPGHPQRTLVVRSEDACRKAVARVVGDLDRMIVAVVRDHRDDGTENLLATYSHRVIRIDQNGWLHEPAGRLVRGSSAANADSGTFRDAQRNVALDPVALAARDQRADQRRRVQRVADRRLTGRLTERLHDFVVTLTSIRESSSVTWAVSQSGRAHVRSLKKLSPSQRGLSRERPPRRSDEAMGLNSPVQA